jgi:hypothetical protein
VEVHASDETVEIFVEGTSNNDEFFVGSIARRGAPDFGS